MSSKKISQFPTITDLQSGDMIPVVRNNQNYKSDIYTGVSALTSAFLADKPYQLYAGQYEWNVPIQMLDPVDGNYYLVNSDIWSYDGFVGIGHSQIEPGSDLSDCDSHVTMRDYLTNRTTSYGLKVDKHMDLTSSGICAAGYFIATGNTFAKTHSLRLVDGSEGKGKVLVSDAQGFTTWSAVTFGGGDFVKISGDTMTGMLYLPSLVSTSDITIANIRIGYGGMGVDTNTVVGDGALTNNTPAGGGLNGSQNTSIGNQTLHSNTSGYYNTALGSYAMWKNTTGHQNTALGNSALTQNLVGNMNTAVGTSSLTRSNGDYNTAIGSIAMDNNTTGSCNTAVGMGSLYLVNGNNNIGLGYRAGLSAVGNYELYIDSYYRNNNTEEKNNAIIYGNMAQYASAQTLYLNAKVFINKNYSLPTTTGASGQVLMADGSLGSYWGNITSATLGGNGTSNYVAKWNSTSGLTNSLIQDDGTSVGIGIAPYSLYQLLVSTTKPYGISSQSQYVNTSNSGINAGVYGQSVATSNYGINCGVFGQAINNNHFNYAGYFSAQSASTGTNVGVVALASAGINNYGIQISDGSQGIGKVLTCVGANGEANWVTPSTGGTSTPFTGGTIDHLTITNDLHLTNPTSGTTITQILSRNPSTGLIEYVPSTDFVSTSQLARNTAGSGILWGGNITQSSTTHINIDAGGGTISLHQPDGDTFTKDLTWSAKTYISVPVGTGLGHYVFIDINGDVMFKVATDPAEPGDIRSNIYLGLVGHSSGSVITAIISAPVPAFNVINTVDELAQGIGPFSLDGNSIGTSGTLSLSITAGASFQIGGNLHNELNLPNVITTTGLSGSSILNYVKSTAFMGPSGTTIDTQRWDNLGTLTTISTANDAAAHRIWYQPTTNKLYFQYGQAQYTNLTNAINGYSTEVFITPTNLTQNSYLVAVICATKSCVNWTDANKYRLIPQSKFASKGGGGIGAFDTLQSTYNNSTTPEIITDTTRGALTIKRGTAADTDKVLEVLDGSSNINFSVLGNGSVSATTYYGDGSHLTGISVGVNNNIATLLYLSNNC